MRKAKTNISVAAGVTDGKRIPVDNRLKIFVSRFQ